MNKRFFVIFTSVFSGVRKLAILAKVSLNTNTLRGRPRLITKISPRRELGVL